VNLEEPLQYITPGAHEPSFYYQQEGLGLVFVTPLAIIRAMHNYGKLEVSFAIPNFNK